MANAIARTDILDFLVDIVPREEPKQLVPLPVARKVLHGQHSAKPPHDPRAARWMAPQVTTVPSLRCRPCAL